MTKLSRNYVITPSPQTQAPDIQPIAFIVYKCMVRKNSPILNGITS